MWPDSPESGAGLAESPAITRRLATTWHESARFPAFPCRLTHHAVVAQRFLAGLSASPASRTLESPATFPALFSAQEDTTNDPLALKSYGGNSRRKKILY